MLLVAEATARDAAAQRREDQASLDELNARVCAYETRVSEMQANHSASLEATHDAQIEADVVNARLESAERRAALAESRLAEAAAARDEEREELIKELAATRAAATAAHTAAQRATVAMEEAEASRAAAAERAEAAENEAAAKEAGAAALTEKLAVAEADYAHAETLTVDAVRALESERAAWEREADDHQKAVARLEAQLEEAREESARHRVRAAGLEDRLNRAADEDEARARCAALLVAAARHAAWAKIAAAVNTAGSPSPSPSPSSSLDASPSPFPRPWRASTRDKVLETSSTPRRTALKVCPMAR
jgi:colicin import membrane protein